MEYHVTASKVSELETPKLMQGVNHCNLSVEAFQDWRVVDAGISLDVDAKMRADTNKRRICLRPQSIAYLIGYGG